MRDLLELREKLVPYSRDWARADNGAKMEAPGSFVISVAWSLYESKSGKRSFPCGLEIQVIRG
jgi:hypothetical protein